MKPSEAMENLYKLDKYEVTKRIKDAKMLATTHSCKKERDRWTKILLVYQKRLEELGKKK